MAIINGKALVKDGKAVDKVFSNGRQVYGRNLLNNSLFTNPIKTAPDSNSAFYGLQSNVVGSEYVINKDNPNKDLTISTFYVSKLGLPIGMYTSSITITNNSGTVATFQFVLFQGTADTNIQPIVNGNSVPWELIAGNPRVTINIPPNSNARYTFTFSAKRTDFTGLGINQFLIFRETTAVSVTRYSKPKLQQGSIATPWTPAPEDYI